MGIIRTVSKIQDSTIILKIVDGSKIEILKAHITNVPSAAEKAKLDSK